MRSNFSCFNLNFRKITNNLVRSIYISEIMISETFQFYINHVINFPHLKIIKRLMHQMYISHAKRGIYPTKIMKLIYLCGNDESVCLNPMMVQFCEILWCFLFCKEDVTLLQGALKKLLNFIMNFFFFFFLRRTEHKYKKGMPCNYYLLRSIARSLLLRLFLSACFYNKKKK